MASGESFSIVEYLAIFSAFIYGYVATRFFSGWSAMISFRGQIVFSLEHLLWTLLTFGLLIDVWWGSWFKGDFINRHVALYYLYLVPPLVFYIISVFQFPPLMGDRFMDIPKYFDDIRDRNYLAFLALFLSFEAGSYFFADRMPEDTYFNFIAAGFALFGFFSRSLVIHRLLLAAGWSMLILHMCLQPPVGETHAEIQNFSFTEYLTVFIAFIYGFVASRFFSGWGVLITKFDRIILSVEHIAWTLLAFLLLLDLWIGSWLREIFLARSLPYFMLSLCTPLAFYSLSAVIFPVIRNGEKVDMATFFQANKKVIISMFGMVILVNTICSNLMEEEHWNSLENLFRFSALILTATAVGSGRPAVERTVLALGWVMMLIHIAIEPGIG